MCLSQPYNFQTIDKSAAIIGYRNWLFPIRFDENSRLKSVNQNYKWGKVIEGPHKLGDRDSGIYSYYNYNYNKNNNYYNYSYNYSFNYNNYN